MAKATSYKGFGEVHGLREWARLLEVNKDTLRYWLTTKKMTVEQFADANNIKYQPVIDTGRKRNNRKAQAQELIEALFNRSGYDPELVALLPIQATRNVNVFYDGEHVGYYMLDTGALRFTDGVSGLSLLDFPVPDPKICKYSHGGWEVTPETKKRLLNQLVTNDPWTWPEAQPED